MTIVSTKKEHAVNVKFVDLGVQYQAIKKEVNAAIQAVLDSGDFVQGPFVYDFEAHFAQAHRAKHCVSVANGTAALHLAMWALGLKQGDEVLVPTNTFIATAAAVSLTGATPVFVDCDPHFYNIDCDKLERSITPKTKGVIAVHLYGQPADLSKLKQFADKHHLWLIEDCAQAHLATYKGTPVGTFGVAGCFSFYPSKNLGAYGEGGAVICNDDALCEKMKALREHGSLKKYYHDFVGQNYRLHALQAAILDVKLKHLEEWTQSRTRVAQWYREGLAGVKQIQLPEVMNDVRHVYHLYVIRAEKRNQLKEYLEKKGIGTGIHYPVPCHLQKAFADLKYPVHSFPVAVKYAGEILSLPMYPELPKNQVDYVCREIKHFYE